MTRPPAADVVVRKAHARDAAYLADNLREADLTEIRASGAGDAQRAIERSIAGANVSWLNAVQAIRLEIDKREIAHVGATMRAQRRGRYCSRARGRAGITREGGLRCQRAEAPPASHDVESKEAASRREPEPVNHQTP